MCVHVCAYVYTCDGQRSMSGVLLNRSSLQFLRQSLSLILELTGLARLVGQRALGSHLSLPPPPIPAVLKVQTMHPCLNFYNGTGDLNLDLHAYIISTLQSLSLFPRFCTFFFFNRRHVQQLTHWNPKQLTLWNAEILANWVKPALTHLWYHSTYFVCTKGNKVIKVTILKNYTN